LNHAGNGYTRPLTEQIRTALGMMLTAVAVALIAGCGSSKHNDGATEATSSNCQRAARTVDGYDLTVAGASRGDYLVLLHRLQRDCPSEAETLGLTGAGLPQCTRETQDNCTWYRQP